jgi:hypothetical protein
MLSCTIAARSRPTWMQAYFLREIILVIFAVCVARLIAPLFAAGRNSIQTLTTGMHEMNKSGSYCKSYIYPAILLCPFFLKRANLEKCWLLDIMVEGIVNEKGWVRWARAPALWQHIRPTSSEGYSPDNTAIHLGTLFLS